MSFVRRTPGVPAAVVTLAVASVCWAALLSGMNAAPMSGGMGLGDFRPFIGSWAVMTAAMMLPSAVPLAAGFAASTHTRATWPFGDVAMIATYLVIWIGFGAAVYAVFQPLAPAVSQAQPLVAGIALALAGLYSLTPLHRAFRARCRALCRTDLQEGQSPVTCGLTTGVRYAVSCIGCSAGLMVALLVLGMASVTWIVIAAILVAAYKVAALPRALDVALGVALVAAGGWIALWPSTVPGPLI